MNDIVFMGVNDWRAIKQRPQHLAERLALAHRVIYLNPVNYSVLTHVQRTLRRAAQRGWRPRLDVLAERLWAFTPSPALPFSRRVRAFNRVNQALLAAQLRPLLARLGFHRPILWIAFPTGVDLIGRLDERAVVFDCLDNYPDFFLGRERASVAAMGAELLAQADLVLATAQSLLEECRGANPNAHLVPNGVDVAHFARARQGFLEPDELRDLPHPRFGYVGTIGRWTDVDALMALARTAPSGCVVVIGPWERALPDSAPPNFRPLGPRPYQRLPEYLAHLDVALIPFKLGPLTQAVNPVKLFEYAAAGLPIVATATQELARYADWCTLAGSSQDFVAAAVRAAEEARRGENQAQLAKAASAAESNDWQRRAEDIERLIALL